MSLVREQHVFLTHVERLLARARALGFIVTGGELYRTPEQQRIHLREGRSRTMASQHLKRLAIDLNFFRQSRDGALTLCYDKGVLQPLGDFWEALDPANRWGGNWSGFKDTPHFERRAGSKSAAAAREAAPAAAPVPAAAPERGVRETRGAGLLAEAVGWKRPNRRADVATAQILLNAHGAEGRFAQDAPLAIDGAFGANTHRAIVAFQTEVMGFGEPDGVLDAAGPSIAMLAAIAPEGYSALLLRLLMLAASDAAVARFAEPVALCLERCGIDTALRQAHFLAQIGHESGELRFVEELASGEAYEGRADLGNIEPGDGRRFRGRGLIQLTGRSNYARFGAAIGRRDEILAHPERLADEPELAARAAGWFWEVNGLNGLADADDLTAVTRRINGGLNGVEHRRALLDRAKALYGLA